MQRTADYAFFAERYHWTQHQVDGQKDWYISRLPDIAQILDEIAEERRPKP